MRKSLSFAADAGGRGAAPAAARAQQDRGDQVPAEEARENCDPCAGIRNSRDPKPRPEVSDPRAGDAEAQAGRHAEPPRSDLLEAGRGHDVVSAVHRARSAA